MNAPDDDRSGDIRSSAFDPEALGELEDLFGRIRLMELLGVLDGEIASRLDPQAPEPDRLARDAHALVSSSGALSFHALSSACTVLEQACLSGAGIESALGNARCAGRQARAVIARLRAA